MKIKLPSKKNSGMILFLCLCVTIVIGLGLVSYLTLVEGENGSTARSQAWNSSMALSEAGIEEGMALINKYAGTGNALYTWANTATNDGWTQNGNVYSLQRNFGQGYYTVYVTNVSLAAPMIKSTGTVLWTNGTVTAVSRSVLVNAGSSGFFFQGALLAKQGISLTGGSLVDSFNSTNSSYSSNGQYVASLHEAHGSVMTDASNVVLTSEFWMSGNGHVYGHLYTGPDDTASLSGNATVGDTNFAGPGIESGWTNSTANFMIPNAPPLPSVTWSALPAEVNNTYILNGNGSTNYYQIPSSFGNLSGQNTMLVTNGTVMLDVEGNFQMSGQSAINLATNNASVVMWLNGNSPQISGQGVVNPTGFATNITVYGTTNCTSIQYSGNAAFVGTIYAPYADVKWSGNTEVIGSVVASSFENSGGANFHYDESLAGGTNSAGAYVATFWTEVSH